MAEPRLNTSGMALWMERIRRHRGVIAPIGFVLLLFVLLVPLPPVVLDMLITINISLAVLVLLTTMYMSRPLDFSVFPSLLLGVTLLRLTLNVASTRLILTADAASPQEAMGVAGNIISAFGEFVAGDSLFVGVVIFLILNIVQFMVVTKGAGRISEVAARFTLDAMPGKQMAIDSDLNAGVIDEHEARRRRQEISQEADFFGAMDGASKFVRGDAIAGIIITLINIAGGFAIGILDRGWPAGQTAEVFTKLTIGDGLTAQIPALVVSIAAALIVTRSGSKDEVGNELADQLTSQPKGLVICSGLIGALALTPLPTVPLAATAMGLGLVAWGLRRSQNLPKGEHAPVSTSMPEQAPIESLLKIDTMELEVGYGLVGLVDRAAGGDLLERISGVRRQLAAEIGLVMPPVRIRDNVQLGADEYRFKIRSVPVAGGVVKSGLLLAMDAGLSTGRIEGEPTKEPAFGLAAWWIEPALRSRAEAMNYTVVEPTSVIATHLSEVVKSHADELLTRDEVANLIEGLKQRAPKLVEEAIPAIVKPADVQRILQSLLRERVPIRDMETIVEALAEWAPKTKDHDVLVEYVRHALRRAICQHYATPDAAGRMRLACITLDPAFEDQINAYIDRGPAGTVFSMPAATAERLVQQVAQSLEKLTGRGHHPVVVASPQVRAVVRQMLSDRIPSVAVLGYNEVASGVDVETVALVSPPHAAAA
ncbi:MAG: flagellar biosynthesis protein FlhA [Phycisphaeraceae bacterium]|nr:flagellar biosynthesis protein FlhA [Phycisphaeraceae bacterium]